MPASPRHRASSAPPNGAECAGGPAEGATTMHARGHNGVRERAVRLRGWLRRRWRRAVLILAVLTVVVPLGADVARNAMSGDGWSLGEALGSEAGNVDFDEINIKEPSPDEVVDAGFAPDPGFFSDD